MNRHARKLKFIPAIGWRKDAEMRGGNTRMLEEEGETIEEFQG